jgi:hypothetical protein
MLYLLRPLIFLETIRVQIEGDVVKYRNYII